MADTSKRCFTAAPLAKRSGAESRAFAQTPSSALSGTQHAWDTAERNGVAVAGVGQEADVHLAFGVYESVV